MAASAATPRPSTSPTAHITTQGDTRLRSVISSKNSTVPAHNQPVFSKSEFFRRTLPAGALVRLLANLVRGRRVGETRELDFRPWGGAYNRLPIDATAYHVVRRLQGAAEPGGPTCASPQERPAGLGLVAGRSRPSWSRGPHKVVRTSGSVCRDPRRAWARLMRHERRLVWPP